MESLFTLAAGFSKEALVQDLSAVLLVAGIVAALLHVLGWPKVIGYIIAGAIISTKPLNNLLIVNNESISVLSNLGVIFLMFTLGLELNIRKLRKAGGTVFPAAIFDLGMMLLVGYAIGRHAFHWDLIPSLFLGGVICDSSTTLLAKSLAEMGCEKEKFASIIFGITISEDVLTIGIMAVLTGLALTGQFQAGELAEKLGMLVLFLAGVLIFGILLLPRFLNKLLSRLKDDETMLLIVMGICFGISLIAERLEFSLALGAFLVGAVISESRVRNRVIENTMGLRSVFSAVFFVTIGMMVDLNAMWANKWIILLFVAVVIVCKTLNNAIASYVTGQSFRESYQIGVGLAQLGDFAYLVALMGMTLQKGISPYPEMYQMAVGVSIITTLLNPFLLRLAGPFADWQFKRMPSFLAVLVTSYTQWTHHTSKAIQTGGSRRRFTQNCLMFAVNGVLIAIIFLVGAWFAEAKVPEGMLPSFIISHRPVFLWIICSLLVCPFLANGYLISRRIAGIVSEAFVPRQLSAHGRWQNGLRRTTGLMITLLGLLLMAIEYALLSNMVFWNLFIFIGMLTVILLVTWRCWDKFKGMANDAQQTLRDVMNREEEDTMEEAGDQTNETRIEVPPKAGVIGVSLRKLRLRNHTGATVSRIQRANGEMLNPPGPDEVIRKGDVLFILCEPGRVRQATDYIRGRDVQIHEESLTTILGLHAESVTVPPSCALCNQRLADIRLRNRTGATIVKIERKGAAVSAMPGPDDVLLAGDVLSLYGTTEQLASARSLLEA